MDKLGKHLTIFASCCVLLACGGGQDGTGRPDTASTSERQVTSVGTITSDDSVVVNGVEYDTSEADVTIDNEEGTVAQLELGQVVVINGTLDEDGQTGTADSVSYSTNIFGPVSQISSTASINHLVILGQTVRISVDTIYVGNGLMSFADISKGDHLKIVGFVLDNGDLVASYIERVAFVEGSAALGSTLYEINGHVANLNIDMKTFEINDLLVDYSGILNLAPLENGMAVEVLGFDNDMDDQLVAASVSTLPRELPAPDVQVELEGFVTLFRSLDDFEIDGARISANDETIIVGGIAANINLNRKIEVEGRLNGEGVLVAERIILLISYLTSHDSGDHLNSETVTFSWADVNADEYRVSIINDGNILFDQYFSSFITSATVDLPVNGAHLRLSLSTRRDNLWTREDYHLVSYAGVKKAQLLSHFYGDVLDSDQLIFEWSDAGADEYRLWFRIKYGDKVTIHDEYYGGEVTSALVTGLPTDASPLEAFLYSRHGDGWAFQLYHFTSYSSVELPEMKNPKILSPNNGDSFNSSFSTFTWADIGADSYSLILSNHFPYVDMGEIVRRDVDGQITSITLDDLPVNGANMRAVLLAFNRGESKSDAINVTSQDIVSRSIFTNLASGEVLSSGSLNLNWLDVEADEYQIIIQDNSQSIDGDDFNNKVFRQRYNKNTHSATINHLPIDGRELRIALFTRHNLGWASNLYYVKSTSLPLEISEILSHQDGDKLSSDTVLFQWSNVNADEYQIKINQQDGSLIQSKIYSRSESEALIGGLPINGEELKLTLITRHGSVLSEKVYVFSSASLN